MPLFTPDDLGGRLPPGQTATAKFPVMTAGTPHVTPAAEWTLELVVEDEAGTDEAGVETVLGRWDMAAFRALGLETFVCDIHCVTRWSKLDTRWRGVRFERLIEAADRPEPAPVAGGLPFAYLQAQCDGGYAANLKRRDLGGAAAFVAVELHDGAGFAPLPEAHGGPARLVAPRLYFWKSAKWLRRLVLSPYDRKGYWERLGYHNHGDPWREQRYRGHDDETDWRRTLDPELSRRVRDERRAARRNES